LFGGGKGVRIQGGALEPPLFTPTMVNTLWLFNIAMENGPFIDDL
jgi:hypothetical protein